MSFLDVFLILTLDLSGSDYSAAPLSNEQEVIVYGVNSNWTATFSNPVTNLLLYPAFWRGEQAGVDPVTYTFDQPFTILSGLSEANVVGNTISVPATVFADGIIQFSNPVSSLSLATNATSSNQQAFTFGVVPEPLTILGAGTAAGFGAFFKRKLAKAKKK